jgi:hypothetical protein
VTDREPARDRVAGPDQRRQDEEEVGAAVQPAPGRQALAVRALAGTGSAEDRIESWGIARGLSLSRRRTKVLGLDHVDAEIAQRRLHRLDALVMGLLADLKTLDVLVELGRNHGIAQERGLLRHRVYVVRSCWARCS